MIADGYFELRARLGSALYSLASLAEGTCLHPSPGFILTSLVEGLREPFLLVVSGEVNAGKSMLLNALFGADVCQTGPLPTTDRIHYFSYGDLPAEKHSGRHLIEYERPHSFLNDFHIVDTPGINSIAEGHDHVTETFIPRADAVLFVFPATNPWGSSAWGFLEKIRTDWRKKIVLVLQQCDLRSAAEIQAIASHLKLMAEQRMGPGVPFFAVSARKALLSRTSALDKERLLEESGFPALEAHLASLVTGDSVQLEKMHSALRSAKSILSEIHKRQALTTAASKNANDALQTIRDAIRAQESNTLAGLDDFLTKVEVGCLKSTQATLPTNKLLQGPSARAELCAGALEEKITKRVNKSFASAMLLIEEDLAEIWQEVGALMEENLQSTGYKPPADPPPPPDGWGESFRQSLLSAAMQAHAEAALAQSIIPRWRLRRGWLLFFVVSAALALGSAITGLWISLPTLTYPALALLAVALLCGWMFHRATAREIRSLYLKSGEALSKRLRSQLSPVLAEQVRMRYVHLAEATRPLEDHAAALQATHEPNLHAAAALERNFRELEQLLA